MQQLDIRQTQEALFGLLVEFDRVCREYKLRYSLAFGTTIGAVRHKGFIPWDDDVDVCMPRADYEKLIEIIKAGDVLGEHFSLTSDRGKDAEYPFVKIMDDRFPIKSTNHIEVPYLYIDIFPLDGLPDTEKKIKKLYNKELTIAFFSLLCRWYTVGRFGFLLRIFGFWLYLIAKCVGQKRIIGKLNKMALSYPFETSKYVGVHGWGRACGAMPREAFENYTEIEFEGKKFMCLKDTHEYLTRTYGDYMTPPPPKKRKTRHDMKVFRKEET